MAFLGHLGHQAQRASWRMLANSLILALTRRRNLQWMRDWLARRRLTARFRGCHEQRSSDTPGRTGEVRVSTNWRLAAWNGMAWPCDLGNDRGLRNGSKLFERAPSLPSLGIRGPRCGRRDFCYYGEPLEKSISGNYACANAWCCPRAVARTCCQQSLF